MNNLMNATSTCKIVSLHDSKQPHPAHAVQNSNPQKDYRILINGKPGKVLPDRHYSIRSTRTELVRFTQAVEPVIELVFIRLSKK